MDDAFIAVSCRGQRYGLYDRIVHKGRAFQGMNYRLFSFNNKQFGCVCGQVCEYYKVDNKMRGSQATRGQSQLEEGGLDPLEVNELIFEQRIFLPLRMSQDEQPEIYPIVFKTMRAKNSERILIYILSEADLYFLYRIDLSQEHLSDLNAQYKLSLKKLGDFVEFFRASLEDIQRQEKAGLLEVTSEDEIAVVVKRNVGGRSHVVMVVEGKKESEEVIKVQVAFRYGSLRERIMKKEEKIGQLKEMVRVKNPYLLKNFKQI